MTFNYKSRKFELVCNELENIEKSNSKVQIVHDKELPNNPKTTINQQKPKESAVGHLKYKMFCFSIMKKLYSLNTSSTIRTNCYLTFIQYVFIYHLCTIFGHVSKTCQSDLDSVISLASSMAHCNFPSISAIYEQCFKQTAPPPLPPPLGLNWSNCLQADTDS